MPRVSRRKKLVLPERVLLERLMVETAKNLGGDHAGYEALRQAGIDWLRHEIRVRRLNAPESDGRNWAADAAAGSPALNAALAQAVNNLSERILLT